MTEGRVGLTRREMLKRGAAAGGALMWATPVVQAVGMRRASAQTPSDTCIPDNWAVEATFVDQGVRLDGTAVLAARSNPANALGNDLNTFFSLGFKKDGAAYLSPGGVIRVRLGLPAYKHTGSEVLVVEATGGTYPLERAEVWVSSTNSLGTFAGYATNVGTEVAPDRVQSVIPFPAGVDVVEFITLRDDTDPTLFGLTTNYDSTTMPDAFDLVRVGTGCTELE